MMMNKTIPVFNVMSHPDAKNHFGNLDLPKQKFWEVRNLADDQVPELLIYGVIGDDGWFADIGSKELADDLLALRGRDIKVRINSVGGGVYAGFAIYSSLKQHNAKVTVYIDALAASAASIVAMAGDEVIMPEFAQMMIHNPWSIAMGESKDFREAADHLDRLRDLALPIYESKTGLSRDEIVTMLDEETWLSAAEAKEHGFADTVDPALKVAASIRDGQMTLNGVSFSMDRFKTLPAALVAVAENSPQPNQPKPAGTQSASRTEDVMTLDEIKSQHPDLYKQIMDAGRDEGIKLGVDQERDRIKNIEEMSMPGHDELVNKAKFESGETAEQLAVNIVKAEKQRGGKFLQDRDKDAKALDGIAQDEPDLNPENSADEEKRKTWRKGAANVAGSRGK